MLVGPRERPQTLKSVKFAKSEGSVKASPCEASPPPISRGGLNVQAWPHMHIVVTFTFTYIYILLFVYTVYIVCI